MADKRAADDNALTSAPKRPLSCCPSCKRKFEYLPEINSDIEILSVARPELRWYTPCADFESPAATRANDVRVNELLRKYRDALMPMLDAFAVGTHRVSDLMENARLDKLVCTFQRHYAVYKEFLPSEEPTLDVEIHMSELRWSDDGNTATMELGLIWQEPNPDAPDISYSCAFVGPILRIALRIV